MEAYGDDQFVGDESADGAWKDDLALGVDWPDGDLIAYLYATVSTLELVHVWELAVLPAFKRQGAGRTLLYKLAELCVEGDLPLITLAPRHSDRVLTSYFERCGFRTVDPLEAMQATPGEVFAAFGSLG